MKKEDPRITRTKETIHHALLTLLATHDYDDITVQNILDTANINRSTFYKHYLNKDTLTMAIIEKIKSETLLPLLEQRFKTPNMAFAMKAAPILNTVKDTLKILWKIDTHRISLKRQIQEEVKRKYREAVSNQNSISHIDLDFQAMLFSTLATSIMEHFIMSNAPIDPITTQENLKAVLSRLVLK